MKFVIKSRNIHPQVGGDNSKAIECNLVCSCLALFTLIGKSFPFGTQSLVDYSAKNSSKHLFSHRSVFVRQHISTIRPFRLVSSADPISYRQVDNWGHSLSLTPPRLPTPCHRHLHITITILKATQGYKFLAQTGGWLLFLYSSSFRSWLSLCLLSGLLSVCQLLIIRF